MSSSLDDDGMGVVVVHGCPLEMMLGLGHCHCRWTMLGLPWLCVSGGHCMQWYIPHGELLLLWVVVVDTSLS